MCRLSGLGDMYGVLTRLFVGVSALWCVGCLAVWCEGCHRCLVCRVSGLSGVGCVSV